MQITVKRLELDNSSLTAWIDTMGLVAGMPIFVSLAALDTRKAIYNLKDDKEALEAVLREHGLRIHPMIHSLNIIPEIDPSCEWLDWKKENPNPENLKPQGDLALHHLGGLHEKIQVTFSSEALGEWHAISSKIKNRPGLSEERKNELREEALKVK